MQLEDVALGVRALLAATRPMLSAEEPSVVLCARARVGQAATATT
jgi:hypothetical protein